MEHFIGIDLHKYVSQLAVLRESKPASQLRFANDVVTVERVLRKLPRGSKIALEAMGSWWWMVELAQKTGHEVFLSHPKQTKAIASARLKSDKVDALMLPSTQGRSATHGVDSASPSTSYSGTFDPPGAPGAPTHSRDQRTACGLRQEKHRSRGQA